MDREAAANLHRRFYFIYPNHPTILLVMQEAVQQSEIGRKRKTNNALNPKRSEIFGVKSNCGTASQVKKIKGDESEEEELEGKRVGLLKQKAKPLECPIRGHPARLRLKDGAIICREGGHITYPDTRVWLQGVETTLDELREKGVELLYG